MTLRCPDCGKHHERIQQNAVDMFEELFSKEELSHIKKLVDLAFEYHPGNPYLPNEDPFSTLLHKLIHIDQYGGDIISATFYNELSGSVYKKIFSSRENHFLFQAYCTEQEFLMHQKCLKNHPLLQ